MTGLELSGRVLPAIPDGDDGRVTQLTAAWLARRTPNTQREYRSDLTHWWQWCARLGVDPLAARMMHMDAWIATQRAEGVRGDGRPAAEASIARRVAAVSSWYKYLYRNTKDDPVPLAFTNPADTDGRPIIDPDNSETVGLSTAEADRLCQAADADGPRSSALIRLLLYGGLRVGSAIGADIGDLGHDRGWRALTVRMKGGKIRRVPVVPALGDAIDTYLKTRGNPQPARCSPRAPAAASPSRTSTTLSAASPARRPSPPRTSYPPTRCGTPTPPTTSTPAGTSATSRTPWATPTPGPPAGTTGPATTSTGTPPTSSPPASAPEGTPDA